MVTLPEVNYSNEPLFLASKKLDRFEQMFDRAKEKGNSRRQEKILEKAEKKADRYHEKEVKFYGKDGEWAAEAQFMAGANDAGNVLEAQPVVNVFGVTIYEKSAPKRFGESYEDLFKANRFDASEQAFRNFIKEHQS